MQGNSKTIIAAVILAVAVAQLVNYNFTTNGKVISPEVSLAFMKWTQN